ncbi:MAG: agmatine deiminase family protein, partial [Pseudarthrobacter sp.]|nr:agmatine deiminase family protein [Pseudarthrobacter sp.]
MAFIYSTLAGGSAAPSPLSVDAATRMPAEWEAHQGTWMAFPPPNDTFGGVGSPTLDRARTAWTRVARTIARYEPVTVVADPRDATAAREWLGGSITVVEVPLND